MLRGARVYVGAQRVQQPKRREAVTCLDGPTSTARFDCRKLQMNVKGKNRCFTIYLHLPRIVYAHA